MQLGRAIGGVFLIERARGHIPSTFAYPAGIGDLLVAAFAAWALFHYRGREIPTRVLTGLIVIGVLDFSVAFFFGLTTDQGPAQLFFPATPSQL